MIDVSGQEASGRYVVVQMDNGGDQLNLREVKAFGRSPLAPGDYLFIQEIGFRTDCLSLELIGYR